MEDTDHTDAAEIWRLYGRKSTTKDVEQSFGERVGMISLVNYQTSLNESEWHMDRLS